VCVQVCTYFSVYLYACMYVTYMHAQQQCALSRSSVKSAIDKLRSWRAGYRRRGSACTRLQPAEWDCFQQLLSQCAHLTVRPAVHGFVPLRSHSVVRAMLVRAQLRMEELQRIQRTEYGTIQTSAHASILPSIRQEDSRTHMRTFIDFRVHIRDPELEVLRKVHETCEQIHVNQFREMEAATCATDLWRDHYQVRVCLHCWRV
jgi:hypothetical protein